MLNIKYVPFSKYQQLLIIIPLAVFGVTDHAEATKLNAGFVLNEMNAGQRVGYITGVIEGLAYARFLRDRPNERGMNCVYDWYYGGDRTQKRQEIRSWFGRHPDKPVGALLNILIEDKCGE